MKLFDLHCDTATALLYGKQKLYDNNLHVSLKKAEIYEKYVQLTAIFTSSSLSDSDGWDAFIKATDNLRTEVEENGVTMINTSSDLTSFGKSDSHAAFILTVEDVRILDGKLERIEELYKRGVRVITPLWGSETIIGGSHESEKGLSQFGKEAVQEIINVGIIPDISHASFKSADEIMDLCEKAGRTPIASHSDSYTVNPHSRNLTDDRYLRLSGMGGITGINLCPYHLAKDYEKADINSVLENIYRFDSLKSGSIAMGCDLDGTPLPHGIESVADIVKIRDALAAEGFDSAKSDGLFYDTAFNFMKNNLPG